MDHPLPAPESLVPWRTVALVTTIVAAVELVVLLAIGGGALVEAVSARVEKAAVKRAQASAAAAKPQRRAPVKAVAKVPRTKLRVLVLNGNGRQGAAAAAAARVERRGYKIRAVGNADRTDYARSIVMYRPGFVGEGRRLARDLRVTTVTPLDGMRLRELNGAHLVYILGA